MAWHPQGRAVCRSHLRSHRLGGASQPPPKSPMRPPPATQAPTQPDRIETLPRRRLGGGRDMLALLHPLWSCCMGRRAHGGRLPPATAPKGRPARPRRAASRPRARRRARPEARGERREAGAQALGRRCREETGSEGGESPLVTLARVRRHWRACSQRHHQAPRFGTVQAPSLRRWRRPRWGARRCTSLQRRPDLAAASVARCSPRRGREVTAFFLVCV